jgi:hypothetical protein
VYEKLNSTKYEITTFNFVRGDFESELRALQVHMMVKV